MPGGDQTRIYGGIDVSDEANYELGTHHLKCWPESFKATCEGKKSFEIRLYDRDFRPGDMIVLHEWMPGKARESAGYTGRTLMGSVTYIATPDNVAQHSRGAIGEGYVVLGIRWKL